MLMNGIDCLYCISMVEVANIGTRINAYILVSFDVLNGGLE